MSDTNLIFTGKTENPYKCLFYESRICHVRQYLDLTDERLKKEKITTVTEREGRNIQDTPTDPIVRKYYSNTAHWLVSEFCQICPHREA